MKLIHKEGSPVELQSKALEDSVAADPLGSQVSILRKLFPHFPRRIWSESFFGLLSHSDSLTDWVVHVLSSYIVWGGRVREKIPPSACTKELTGCWGKINIGQCDKCYWQGYLKDIVVTWAVSNWEKPGNDFPRRYYLIIFYFYFVMFFKMYMLIMISDTTDGVVVNVWQTVLQEKDLYICIYTYTYYKCY